MAIRPDAKYPGKISPATPAYPYGSARNVTIPGDGTGTPWEKDIVNDIFGFQQSILDSAGISPSGFPDEVGDSQYLTAIRSIFTSSYKTVSDMAADSSLSVGEIVSTLGYEAKGDGGQNVYEIVPAGTGVPDGGEFINLSTHQAKGLFPSGVNVLKCFGAKLDGVDDFAPAQAALNYLGAGGVLVVPADGILNLNGGTLTTTAENQQIIGESWDSNIRQDEGVDFIKLDFDGFQTRNIRYSLAAPSSTTETICIRASVDPAGSVPTKDVVVEGCFFDKPSYAVLSTNAERFQILNNYIVSTGEDGVAMGSALQLSALSDSIVDGNIIIGDPTNRFQHGIYLSGSVTSSFITNNIIRNFWSYGIHLFTSSANDRKDITISNNHISGVNSGILIGRAGGVPVSSRRVVVTDNTVSSDDRSILLQGSSLRDIDISHNMFSVDEAGTNASFEVEQSTGEACENISVIHNTFNGWGAGQACLEINNPVSMKKVEIKDNNLIIAAGGGTLVWIISDPATITSEYEEISMQRNAVSGSYTISSLYGDILYSPWMTMLDNGWDDGSLTRQRKINATMTPFSVERGDDGYHVTTGATDVTISLPNINEMYGRTLSAVKADSGVGKVIIDPLGSQTIGGSLTLELSSLGDGATFYAVEGVGWVVK